MLTQHQRLQQAAHNEAHPGKMCSRCPASVVMRANLLARSERHVLTVSLAATFTVLVLFWIFI